MYDSTKKEVLFLFKQLKGSVREYWKPTVLTPLCVILEVFLEVLIPYLMADLIDKGINAGDMNYILKLGIFLVLAALTSLVFGSLSGHFGAKASAGFAKNLRHDIFYKVQDFSFRNIDHFSTSSLVTRLTTDVTNVQNAYQMSIRIAVRSPIMFTFAMIMAFTVHAEMALVFVALVPILALGMFFIIRVAMPTFQKVFKRYDVLNRVVQETLHGIRVVKSYDRADFEEEKFQDVSSDIFRKYAKAERTVACITPLMQFCVYCAMIAISWFGAGYIVSGSMTTGQLMSMFSYVMMILMSLIMLSMVMVMLTMAKASAERIAEVLSTEIDLKNPENPVMEVKDGSISFENAGFTYGASRNLCLKDVNLTIQSGETIGIIGGTGSSKSTLVQLIPRLYDTTVGTVQVGGLDVKAYDLDALRNAVAMVLQKNVLFSGTIAENLRWGNAQATDEELERACQLAQAHDFISTFPKGYQTHIEQGGTNVSGGQRQRLCIARALLKQPKILILDDSTSAVDTATDSLIRNAFYDSLPDTTKIIIAQRVSSIQDAHRIFVMDGGKVVDVGNHEQLLGSSAIYREVYESQTRGAEAS